MTDEEPWQRVLRDAVAVLRLTPEEQLRINGPGCVACDLISDFESGRSLALGNASNLTGEQRRLLDRINATLEEMQLPDFECFNDKVLRRPVWQRLRELAAETLQAFG